MELVRYWRELLLMFTLLLLVSELMKQILVCLRKRLLSPLNSMLFSDKFQGDPLDISYSSTQVNFSSLADKHRDSDPQDNKKANVGSKINFTTPSWSLSSCFEHGNNLYNKGRTASVIFTDGPLLENKESHLSRLFSYSSGTDQSHESSESPLNALLSEPVFITVLTNVFFFKNLQCRVSAEYRNGVENFLNLAFLNASQENMILCPCKNCVNINWHIREVVYEHLVIFGFVQGYRKWIFHGEFVSDRYAFTSYSTYPAPSHHLTFREYDMEGMLRDAFNMHNSQPGVIENYWQNDVNDSIEMRRIGCDEEPNGEAEKFYKLLNEMNEQLYDESNFSKLSFCIRLFHLKCLGGWIGNSFTQLLELLGEEFPFAKIPQSSKDMKKMIKDLGLGYDKIHSCPNDCMLYWGDRKNQESCHICGKSRWMSREAENVTEDEAQAPSRKKSVKILRYFPLIPRLQRLFMSSKIAESMSWHHDGRTEDGLLRHHADSLAWKSFDNKYPSFARDPRNFRLGLATDGFNPFKIMSTSYSTWPVVLVPYNFPSWICMKQSSFILSKIIPGEKGPGNDIDIYMQPLITELKQLWEGVKTYDVLTNENFNLCATLLWTINDFPAYANLSGWSTKGRYACPCCALQTCSKWLVNGKKFSYMGHHWWLPDNHRYRSQKNMFDGDEEFRNALDQTTGSQIFRMLKNINFTYGKMNQPSSTRSKKKAKRVNEEVEVDEQTDNESDEEDDPNEVLMVEELDKLQDRVALTLCNLEKIFPPSFFTIMVHLLIHLPHEARVGGPIFYRWMYPIERFLGKLKSYCRNKSYPEGSIAEGYLAEECMTFCSRYLTRGRTTLKELYQLPHGNRVKVLRNDDGQPIGPESRLLAGYLGIVGRNVNLLPINYESWREIPNSNKNQALDFVKEKFSLEVSDNYVKQALGKRWRDHKSSLKKKYFKNDLSLEEKLQTVPPGMFRYQWKDAVRFWSSKKGQENTSGSKVGRIQLFDMIHTNKDGTPMTADAAEIMEKLREKKVEHHATASSHSIVNDDDIENQAINDVLGPERYGRVRCQGSFVTPTKYFGSSSSQYMSSQSRSSHHEVSRLKENLTEMDQQMANLKAENEAREAERAAAEAARVATEA
ncbi:hypothetical protein F3Y22_tig00000773pilonHSYRG00216 [Hibiscus syriacus]|uniref:DUF4218 domain-containing protein n=1 Tax=Hibiscus syriacus TaxID=106335 RepID=A0A6A3CY65_HIBSY|nr:hypothetical protein F3Y22_tig00000773pilonHSYRG00216 [Hibiscus syriacus]